MLALTTMRHPTDPVRFVGLIAITAVVLFVVQMGIVSAAFHRLGLSPGSALLLLLSSLAGSLINLPIFRIRTRFLPGASFLPPPLDALWKFHHWENQGRTVVALNVGGGLIPVLFSAYLIAYDLLPLNQVILAVSGVSAVSYRFSRPLTGVGIAMPILIAPLAAALFAVIINPDKSAPLAYIGGTLGVLIGADLLRLKDIRTMGVPLASIGGAGTFDGIFLTGLVAVILS